MRPQYIENDNLAKKSLDLLLEYQEQNGSFVASPNFDQYKYAWLRDGSFCALSTFELGETESCHRFNNWVSDTILIHKSIFENAIKVLESGRLLNKEEAPPTRFELNGNLESSFHEVWPNYQIDGYGTWLVVLEKTTGATSEKLKETVKLVADFLKLAWKNPCYDCWEEGGDEVHSSTLLAVSGGLFSAAKMIGDDSYKKTAETVKEYILENFQMNGHLVKNANSNKVDAALAWAIFPHEVFSLDDEIIQKTIEKICEDLRGIDGGVMRYLGDTYYGGGEWILLEAFVAIYQTSKGNKAAFEKSINWIKGQADSNLFLPEQDLSRVQSAEQIAHWEKLWGLNAKPLLWSHAMYLLLLQKGHEKSWI